MDVQENVKALAYRQISKINQVEGLNPEVLAVEFTDLTTGETRRYLPVSVRMAWFRLKYPNGKIAAQVTSGKDCYIATARIYPDYHDPLDCYLAEATVSRGISNDKPTISPREWAQTAAIGVALRNAGFGVQFDLLGEADEILPRTTEGDSIAGKTEAEGILDLQVASALETEKTEVQEQKTIPVELTEEEKLEKAMQIPCPIRKYAGKTLGEVLTLDPAAINWVAQKYTDNADISEAAKRICEYAMQQAVA